MTLASDRSRDEAISRSGSVRVRPPTFEQIVVHLEGEHDLSTVPALTDAFAHAISTDSHCVLLDLSEVTFIDASTIGALIRLRNRLEQDSRDLTIHEPTSCVSRLIDICCGPTGLSGSDRAG